MSQSAKKGKTMIKEVVQLGPIELVDELSTELNDLLDEGTIAPDTRLTCGCAETLMLKLQVDDSTGEKILEIDVV